ncbi:MAG: glycoside hydrolase family 3 C-terminal domain-containing protein [Vicinamibacteria bacterium]|nr:glycoside hydrolase family 3 C-terminal domain-containing protein [Vicinamibacteria bacterium]
MKPTNNIARRSLFALGVVACMIATNAGVQHAEERPAYLDTEKPPEARVEDLLARLTLDEKLALVHGDSIFTTAAIPRLGVRKRWLSDGPHGVREDVGPDSFRPSGRTDDFASYLPVSIALASTWNPELARKYGEVVGQEARKRGKHVMLGPGVNIMRTPLCGRNFEYMGEDPFLAARLAVAYIEGVQSRGIASCVKHFAANNQEWERNSINVEMDERVLREIYLPAFEAAVREARVLSVMGAYNKFRGQHCCHNDYLLNKILKGEWGFTGVVVSDWNGTHDTREAVFNGLDLEMGTRAPSYDEYFLARPFREGLERGDFPMSALDDKARRNLRLILATNAFEGNEGVGLLNAPAHQAIALRVAEEAIVLLKNEGAVLPLDAGNISSLAVIGENATRRHAHGGGSSTIKAFYEVTPLQGIVERAGDRITVTYAPGYRKDGAVDLVERAVRAARQADAAIVVAGLNHDRFFDSEGADRKDMRLPDGQDELIRRVVEANPRTIVALVSGSPVEMEPWIEKAPAVVQAWYAGMEGGNALARILFGDVNPSGKLACTFPKRLADSPAHAADAYPGKDGTVRYEEGLFVGYRHFDAKNIEPLFAFGHGLSYTRFDYSNLMIVQGSDAGESIAKVEFEVRNVGEREGAEVAQIYVQDVKSSLPRPRKELKAFRKITLKPGARQKVSIPLDRRALAFYEPSKGGWLAEKGAFKILVGASSREIRLEGTLRLPKTTFER